ncbi:MAG: periplasmic heavy metal sensor [Nitrospirae bacterium]|nr:periplasmic heavy metal sensor [Nitrospirota bacterium]
MKKVLLFAIALFLAAGISTSADAAMHGKKKGKGMGPGKGPDMGMMGCCMEDGNLMMEKLMSLGLTDQQKESIRSIHMNMRKENIRGRAGIDVAEIELKEVLMKDPVDLKAAEAKLKQIEALKTDLHFGHIKAHEEVKAVLTAEQRKKFNVMRMEMGPMGMCGCGMGCEMGMMREHGGMGMGKGMKHGCNMKGGMETPAHADKKENATPPSAGHQH